MRADRETIGCWICPSAGVPARRSTPAEKALNPASNQPIAPAEDPAFTLTKRARQTRREKHTRRQIMSVSGVPASPSMQLSPVQSPFARKRADFEALGSALKSGDLAGAQK